MAQSSLVLYEMISAAELEKTKPKLVHYDKFQCFCVFVCNWNSKLKLLFFLILESVQEHFEWETSKQGVSSSWTKLKKIVDSSLSISDIALKMIFS